MGSSLDQLEARGNSSLDLTSWVKDRMSTLNTNTIYGPMNVSAHDHNVQQAFEPAIASQYRILGQ